MDQGTVFFSIFVIFTGAAVLATLALLARQAMLVAYIVLGGLLGPWGLRWVADVQWIHGVSEIGISFLLFLLGLNLLPREVWGMFKESALVTLGSSLFFALLGYAVTDLLGFPGRDALIAGIGLAFSSTIIGLKLLPTTTLHHRHKGQLIISILLLQDLLAIVVLLVLQGYGQGQVRGGDILSGILAQILSLPIMIGVAFLLQRYLLHFLFQRFDQIQEYIFLLVIAWCLGIAQLAGLLGLSHEIGAFLAGVALAASPIAQFIAESLKPLRDFFLVLFFFSLGAEFNLALAPGILPQAALLAVIAVAAKPWVFRWLLLQGGQKEKTALEIGVRLAQVSEFSLLIAVLAGQAGFISARGAYLVQMMTILSFILSSYVVVLRYPTPMAVSSALRRD
jgi:Kef-type K+ transport system membrane component KefB